jgi:hypothetical protein
MLDTSRSSRSSTRAWGVGVAVADELSAADLCRAVARCADAETVLLVHHGDRAP